MSSADFLSTPPEARAEPVAVAALAPLSGVSDVVVRRIAARYGATFVVTEMVAADAYLAGQEEARLRAAGVGVMPHVVQLVGRDPSRMAEAARLAEASGADVIDINMGCPAKRVTGGLAGSALMREPALAVAIVESVVRAVSVPVSLKMRLGWDSRSLNAAELARRSVTGGVTRITVHGRTRQQFYTGVADWAAIAEVVEAVQVPVIANGDVGSIDEARRCLAMSGARGVMIGRAAVGQPWIVGEIAAALSGRTGRSPSIQDRSDVAVEHYDGLLRLYGVELGLRHARKHLAAYADRASEAGFGLPATERRQLLTTTDPACAAALLSRLYERRSEPMRKAA